MDRAIDLTVGKIMDRHLSGMPRAYQFFTAKVYLSAIPLAITKALPHLIRGLFYLITRKKQKRMNEFLNGSLIWGDAVIRMSRAKLYVFNDIQVPEKGHLIFLNHVNELDFPYDCIVVKKPYLANQVIKKTLVAYWWMLAMGSQVFDNRNQMSISISVKNMLKGLKDTSFIVYPEGRNTYTEEIQPLKKGMIKLAYDHKIPVCIILKSGIASYQEYQKGNVIAYKSFGIVNPNEFSDWESFKNKIQEIMEKGKKDLDQLRLEKLNSLSQN